MNNGFLKLGWSDIKKVVVLAVVAVGLTWVVQYFKLDFSWMPTEVKTMLLVVVSYLVKNAVTTNKGNVLGVVNVE